MLSTYRFRSMSISKGARNYRPRLSIGIETSLGSPERTGAATETDKAIHMLVS